MATRHTVRLELTRGETTRLLSITSQSPNRIDFDADRRDFDDAPILIQIEDIGGSISYLQSDGTLSGAPTAFNPSIVFGPGAVLDASSILIDE